MYNFEWTTQLRFIVALVLGFLVGLERETAGAEQKTHVFAGLRTYTLTSLYGFGCAWLFRMNVELALPAGLLSVAALVMVEYLAKSKEGHTGWTSEVAALLTFGVGALALLADIWVPMALGIIGTVLLSEKAEFGHYVERLDKAEFLAVLKFMLITLIVLPVLPNQEYTQFQLNPTHIWQIVILVSSIGFVGYFLSKRLGSKVGLWLSGLLGGIVSSTAVSVAAGRIAQRSPEQSEDALQASLLASSVMYLRILAFVSIINPAFLRLLGWKLIALAAIGLILSVRIKTQSHPANRTPIGASQNPFEIRPAVIFAVLYAVVSVITVLVQQAWGNTGLVLLSAVTGVTDIDPFILSLVHNTTQVYAALVSAILIAMMSNTVLKGVYFGTLAKGARKETFWRYGVWAVLHLPLILLP